MNGLAEVILAGFGSLCFEFGNLLQFLANLQYKSIYKTKNKYECQVVCVFCDHNSAQT